jgi:hypothetical protein
MLGFRKHAIRGGQINRCSFKPGDIFINYNNSVIHNPFKPAQIVSGNISYSSFAHGGLVISDMHIMHAGTTAEGPIVIEPISDAFNSKREYRIYRPIDPLLSEEMVEVAIDLYWNKYIPFAGLVMPDPKHMVEFLRQARACKGDRALIRFLGKGRETKVLADIRAEYKNMLRQSPDLACKIEEHQKELEDEVDRRVCNGEKMNEWEAQAFIKKSMEQYLATLTPTGVKAKKFFCTQFVTWVIQAATGVLHERVPEKFKFDIADVLDIRDTKATPARLADMLKHSKHFIEFKSEESYKRSLESPSPILGVASTSAEIVEAQAKMEAILLEAQEVVKIAQDDVTRMRVEMVSAEADVKKAKMEVAKVQASMASEKADLIAWEKELARLQAGGVTSLSLTSRAINWLSGYAPIMLGTTAAALEGAAAREIPIAAANVAETKERIEYLKLHHAEQARVMEVEVNKRAEEVGILLKLAVKRSGEVMRQKDLLYSKWPFINRRMLVYEGVGTIPSPKKWLAPLPPLPPKRTLPPPGFVVPPPPSAGVVATLLPVVSNIVVPSSASKGFAPPPPLPTGLSPMISNRISSGSASKEFVSPSSVPPRNVTPLVPVSNQGILHPLLRRPPKVGADELEPSPLKRQGARRWAIRPLGQKG